MSTLFKQIEGDTAVLVSGGVYKVVDLYERNDGELYVAFGGGYLRLYADGHTSKDKVSIDALVTSLPLSKDKFGRLAYGDGKDRKMLSDTPLYLTHATEDQ